MKEKIAVISVLVNMILAAGKLTAGFAAGSQAVFAEGMHSGMDVLSSVISYIGIKISRKPVDEKHPYGHYKFEVLAGLIITVILLITGLFIISESIERFKNPSPLNASFLALVVMLISAMTNEVMARLKINTGKKENSISLLSDGVHCRIDVFTSLAVLAGLFLAKYWIYTDSLLAFLIGLYIMRESFILGKEAVDSLLDISAGDETEGKIRSIAGSQNIDISSLKTQKKGSVTTANLEIKLPNSLNVEKAVNISDHLRKTLMEKINSLSFVAIQIKSHEIETGYFKPGLSRGFGWQARGRFKTEIKKAVGYGPGGYCICPKCAYKTEHQRGTPCSTIQCPHCKINLERK